MRRALRWIGLGVAVLVGALGALAWYVKGLPWRNRCGAPIARAVQAGSTTSAVATSQPLATRAAADVLTEGGSAADAAVAAALVLGVVEPGNSGLGGGGFALVHDPKHGDLALDFRERAPLGLDLAELTAAVKRNSGALRNGPLAVAVPTEWAGLVELHRRFGRLPLTRLARPAVEAARDGVPVGTDYSARCWVRLFALRKDPEARRTFMTGAGLCPLPGWTLRQPELAQTIAALAADGRAAAWNERVGGKMVAFLAGLGSRISQKDLEAPAVVERPVVTGRFYGRRIVTMGPPSGGLLVVSLLQTYEQMRARLPDANALHLWTEASRLVFYDRARLFGDPDFVKVPAEKLASREYAVTQAARAQRSEAIALPADAAPREGSHTTHFSVVDPDGLAIALTQTINVPFGAGLVVPGTGVLLNDEMDDFYLEGPNAFGLLGNDLNAPAPGKRPLSSMSPTFVFDDEGLRVVLGSPGGSSIPTAVAWVIRELIEGGRSAEDAVRSPRVHHQWMPDVLEVEPGFDRSALPADLRAHMKTPLFPVGRVQLLVNDRDGWRGVSDCRDEGASWAGAPKGR
jgi:gamma-glutamyltranspeptidase/glutathione hydrolase